ncbi:hypothetical protein SAMN05421770_103206 [Granulicella rosea]|uniref:DUF4440 domain-containing protein n=1 Tax=Granulicella rosea TaxID=474952 RepID=A0A239IP42_9BACT|nr:hypothetical protein [Granulicella rosea]SNS95317.1 hypothetical protein SAMN05421770_103206 [Granulicella rosea]
MEKNLLKQLAAGVLLSVACAVSPAGAAFGETCTPQSQMQPGDRNDLVTSSTMLAKAIQNDDQASVKSTTIAEYATNFGQLGDAIGRIAPKLKGGALTVEQVYLLDASLLKKNPDGSSPDAQFFCSLNRTTAEADFNIPGLPPGRYAFSMVNIATPAPYRLSLLLRQDGGKWLMAGFYPKATTAAGHDGLWFWKEARTYTAQKHPWDAWLYYQQARALLEPAGFVDSTHLEKLKTELASAAPPAVADGVGQDNPLVVKGADGVEYRFTGIFADNSLDARNLDVALHMKVDPLSDAAAARKRNLAAMTAVLAAYPELKTAFHGLWIFAEADGQNPYATELSMAEIP